MTKPKPQKAGTLRVLSVLKKAPFHRRLRQGHLLLFSALALLMLVDFAWPGRTTQAKVLGIQVTRENYYNAAQNFHYSYKVRTEQHQFSVSEAYAAAIADRQETEYSVSRIFREVNWYRWPTSGKKGRYILRILSALVLPLLAILVFALQLRYGKYPLMVFILQAVLLGNLFFLWG